MTKHGVLNALRVRIIFAICCVVLYPNTGHTEWRVMGIPFANFTADKGMGYGIFGSTFDQIEGAQKPPYRLSIGGQFYQTTGGYAFHKLLIDYPRPSYRLTLVSGWENWATAPYFGSGARTVRDLTKPLEYYQVDLSSLWIQPQARFDLWSDLEGLVLLTYRQAHVGTGAGLLDETKPIGHAGGGLMLFAFGLTLDERDREPTPTRGYWIEASVGAGSKALGSAFDTQTVNLTHRHWWSLDEDAKVVLASRTSVDLQRKAPFFQESAFGGSQLVETGGHSMLRGLETGRVRGSRKAAQTFELHYRFNSSEYFGRKVAPILVTFAEGVYVAQNDTTLFAFEHLLASAGLGARAVLDEAFVLRFDLGISPEYVLNESGARVWRNRMGSYVIVGHSF